MLRQRQFIQRAITFDSADDEIKSSARVTLDDVASRLLGNNHRTRVTGYADGALQAEQDDRRLSLRRAVAVRRYLMEKGVTENRIDVFARGEAGKDKIGARINIYPAP